MVVRCRPHSSLLLMPTSEIFNSSSSWSFTIFANSRSGMGRVHHGLHHGTSNFKGTLSYYGNRGSSNQICPFWVITKGVDSQKVAKLFVDTVARHHGFPCSIISDRDPVFMGTLWRKLFELSGTQLSMSSVYHPQMDGQTEVFNCCLE